LVSRPRDGTRRRRNRKDEKNFCRKGEKKKRKDRR